ncbi:long-chain-fatty-acid--CoA ligase [Micromonospora sp. NBC_01796]|uniref:long-chain-fatty-acid--CoA ligase n=1 Tax=Micromonospora sp. NBC_01796 TaxID=2975987 RepID=UPI002DD7F615|nr:long-chain-fatty-acid--CoA ligase [Micromonospora sp. NBC_01796]WSA86653.1 long-chain-fatty-acid--CoA ligase [Micromonospora sp. NBC_01796]
MTTTLTSRTGQTLQDSVGRHAADRPDHPAVVAGPTVIGYGELHRRGGRTATALAGAGIGPGSRVAHFGRDSELYYELLLGCARLGAVLVPIDWRLTGPEVDHVLRDSGSELVFVEPRLTGVVAGIAAGLPRLRATVPLAETEYARWRDTDHPAPDPGAVAADRDTPVLQVYTSGTTGAPKGVVLAQRTFFAITGLLAEHGLDWIDWRVDDRSLVALPGFHIGGIWWLTQGLNAGITNVVLPVFDSERAVELIRELGITTTCLVPAMLRLVVDEPGVTPADFGSVRKVVYGGSPISEALLRRCLDMFNCEMVQIYGLTETGNTAVCLPPAEHRLDGTRLAAAGRPYPGVGLRVVDGDGADLPTGAIGQVLLRTPARMVEYWNQPEKTAATLVDGWIHTGDAGYLDDEGYLFIRDRINDTIIVGGENVYPAEVENAISGHPAVVEAAVVGAPDPTWGERICAFVVLRAGQGLTAPELTAFLRERLAQFKIPTSVEFVDTVPRTPSGKILRRALRDRLWAGRQRKVN